MLRRARIGPLGWSIMERGAVFQHNHSPAPHALDPASHACSRSEALTLRVFDASTMLGHPGQTGWTHRPDGKANAMRVTADPVIYVCPAVSLHAQLVFNLRNFRGLCASGYYRVPTARGPHRDQVARDKSLDNSD